MIYPVSFIWLTLCVYHEARGEPREDQMAVVHTILNRAEERGLSVKEVILQPFQFSWANQGKRPFIKDYQAFERCAVAVYDALEERYKGKTLKGANHYHAVSVDPSWTEGMKRIAHIGRHIFYKG